ncbi:MAG: trigger factor [Candidatus Dependentiae bacterium]|nr:trigger factor [Candidatus Dependentiae bacterium]
MVTPHMRFSWEHSSSCFIYGDVTVDQSIVNPITSQMARLYQHYSALPGYEHKKLPLEYARSYFAAEIKQDTQEFIYKHFVLQFLLDEIHRNQLITANWPRLTEVKAVDGTLVYRFTLTMTPAITLKEWKHFVFKQPERKNYKDLDNQVVHFIKQATDTARAHDKHTTEPGDWISFSIQMLNPETQEPLFDTKHNYWIRMSSDVILSTLQQSFSEKKVGDSFIVDSLPFINAPQSSIDEPCHYKVVVESITKGSHMSLEFFKQTFKLKTRADVHKKLIEVFSYRNDISQRRSTIEELFHLLFTKHRFEMPKHIITRKKESLLSIIKRQSDYNIYKNNKSFDTHLTLLAEKMLKEELIIDNIGCTEEIEVTSADIAHYLHLFNNERLKEFIYFKPFIDNIEDSNTPLHEAILAQAVLREKTLNYILHTLS